MASAGFITNAGVPPGAVGTTYALANILALTSSSATDAKSLADLPAGGVRWSHLRVKCVVASGSPTTADAVIWWDSIGDDLAAGPSQSSYTLQAGLTATTERSVAIPIDIFPRAPAEQTTAGTLYVSIKVDTGTITIRAGDIQLHWVDAGQRG
tara:strand:- start:1122 stop:1580 length:459 start_codon:yes stop_codon:yes gene_type:complete